MNDADLDLQQLIELEVFNTVTGQLDAPNTPDTREALLANVTRALNDLKMRGLIEVVPNLTLLQRISDPGQVQIVDDSTKEKYLETGEWEIQFS